MASIDTGNASSSFSDPVDTGDADSEFGDSIDTGNATSSYSEGGAPAAMTPSESWAMYVD